MTRASTNTRVQSPPAAQPAQAAPSFVRASDQVATETTLEAIRDKLREAREEEAFLADLQAQAKDASARLHIMYSKTLPDMMSAAGVDIVGLPPAPGSNDAPTFDAKLVPFYSANIAAAWPDDKRNKAFKFLKDQKAEDLIRNTFTVKLGKGTSKVAKEITAFLRKQRVEFTNKQDVHGGTLTAWLREQYEDHGKNFPLSELETIGASVGKMVTLKQRKE